MINQILIALLTSGTIAGLALFIVRTWFKAAVEHQFAEEKVILEKSWDKQLQLLRHEHEEVLAKLGAKLTQDAELRKEILARRLEMYPRLAELVYRVRNLAREALQKDANKTLIEEFVARSKELQEQIFVDRLDLDRDGLFERCHEYKNTIATMALIASRRSSSDAPQDSHQDEHDLADLFAKVEATHLQIIRELTLTTGGAENIRQVT